MTPRDEASETQVRAADPAASTWLAANAGSGKTRVLTDRVARLLLSGTDPQRILCLTYTKAAAAEMQNRLFRRLGEWAMLEEGALRAALDALGADGPIDATAIAAARRLFARAIETPGGLKIQTIHSFCAGLLRRFPLEAGVPPDFTEMDDRAAALMREEVLQGLADGADIGAVDALATLVGGDEVDGLLALVCRAAPAFDPPLDPAGARDLFDLPRAMTQRDLIAQALDGGEAGLFAALIPILRAGKASDVKLADALAGIDLADPGLETLAALEGPLLYGAGARAPFDPKIGDLPTKDVRLGPAARLMPAFEALMQRVADTRPRRIAFEAAEKTAALHRFAAAFLPRYTARKARRGWLDFDDLITRAAALLSDRGVAQWVLWRLDGGIDHILVDEAQDTSPAQWQVIERLAEEFTAGEGARDVARTIFVVGDKKQSIYSFQGADLTAFDRMRGLFRERFEAAGAALVDRALSHSFRSAEAILRLVDLTFDERLHRGIGGPTKHIAFHSGLPGRVDLWPPVPKPDRAEDGAWDDPVDLPAENAAPVVLARQIAGVLKGLIDTGTMLPTATGKPRPLTPGDILILVQRRSDLFAEIIRACKAAGLAVAGADRLKLGAELAVRDLAALLSFLATPEDDLSLAAALRSPLFGWSEDDLYRLAQPRPARGYLWTALRETQAHAATRAVLTDLRDAADFLRPFELIERILTRHDGRRRLIARLGQEAEDGVDAFLAQALAYERMEVPSLTGFLVWLETDEVEVKRQLDSGGGAIRVMTVHGAKGLEAPVVILPDTGKRRVDVRDQVLTLPQGPAVWKAAKDASPPAVAALRDAEAARQEEERMRLLYVAMTRAEVWLIVAAAGDVGKGTDSWHALVDDGMARAGAVLHEDPVLAAAGIGPVLRHANGDWPAPGPPPDTGGEAAAPVLPGWARTPAPPLALAPLPLSPSDLGGAKALPGEAGAETEVALRQGRQLHLLLEHLPDWPEADWPGLAEHLLATGADAADTLEAAARLAEARRVLTAPDLAGLFGPGALAEVEIAAALPDLGGRRIRGTIDRLLPGPGRVLAVDFKTNAMVPDRPETVPDGILRQMGAYAAALAQVYPGRRIETAILWTRGPRLMPLPDDLVMAALHGTALP